ncbi:MAG: hypothetical protein A3F84_19335, partial [Candidatus Handelsmanbacteria bacterium RIFCSPLOWO2_12_FULL_64_10]
MPTAIPTLARLSFWVPPERMAEFEVAYREKLVPILKAHGLAESSERGRATPADVFSRLFEFNTPSEVEEKQKTLRDDPAWTAALRGLGTDFGTTGPDVLIRHHLMIYSSLAGPGTVVSASPGKVTPAGRGRGHWRNFDVTDGLAGAAVRSILQDQEGALWFGIEGGVSRYDGKSFISFTTRDGLAHNLVLKILQDREGILWFGTWGGGVSRYDPSTSLALRSGQAPSASSGHVWTTFTARDGLADDHVGAIFQDREGYIWFGTKRGVSRYDGKSFITLTTRDGLAHNTVYSILQDREGYMWFMTWGGGVSRYDGKSFITFTTKDGLAFNAGGAIFQDRDGNLWFGTRGGVSRYDGKSFTNFTTKDGLVDNRVRSVFQDQEGVFWFGALWNGVSRYDGKSFTNFTTKDGLINDLLFSIFQDREGNL